MDKDDDWVDMDIENDDRDKFKDIEIQVDEKSDVSGFISSILCNDKKLFSVTGLYSVKLLNTLTSFFNSMKVH